MYKIFGINLRKMRKQKKLTAQMIADLCDVSRSYITLIENGQRLPGKKLIPKFASVLQMPPVTVLNWYLEDISQEIQGTMPNT